LTIHSKRYADLHVHVSLKQIVNRLGNIWYTKQYDNNSDVPDRSEAGEYTQSDVTTLQLGKVDFAIAALYPLEDIVDKYFINKTISKLIFGFDAAKVKRLRKRFPTKFDLLNHERSFIEAGPFKARRGRLQYHLVKNKAELSAIPTKIILSLEGAHGLSGAATANTPQFQNEVIANLIQVKNWTYPVFMMTLCHFQYNHMAGHSWAIPLPDLSKPVLKKVLPLLRATGKESVSPLGKMVIDTALDQTNGRGRRILIDLKHASVQTRKWYYTYLKDKPDIPVIVSHTGISGITTFKKQLQVLNEKANEANRKANGNPLYLKFNPWAINLCDEDIKSIHQQGGMIGISLDQRILGSGNKSFKKLIKRTLRRAGFPDNKKNWHSALFLENIFHVIQTAGAADMWKMVCVSSDNDGIIDPIDACPTARHFPQFERRLENMAYPYYLNSTYNGSIFINSKTELEDQLRRVFLDNLKDFVEDNFPS